MLCKKYDVSLSKLKRIAGNEDWVGLKEQCQTEADTLLVETIAIQNSKHNVDIYDVTDKLLEKIESMIEAEGLTTQNLKHLTSAIKDIKDIKGIKTNLDLKEQQARIDKLQKEIDADGVDEDKPSGVVLMPPILDELVPPKGNDNG
jgi:hypothetical protein